MNQENQQADIVKIKVVLQIPGTDDVIIKKGVKYRVSDDHALTMDIYYPPDSKRESRKPVVILVFGYSDPTMKAKIGVGLKEMGAHISWGRLIAASGMVAITYETTEPVSDVLELFAYVRQNASSLGIDENRIGIFACSGNVPNALSLLMHETSDYLKCAVLYYGFMLDSEESDDVAVASKTVGFVNPCAGKTIADLRQDIPLFIVRAGQDNVPYNLNRMIDRFLGEAMGRNMPVTFINYPDGPHGFDSLDDCKASREIIRQTLTFMRFTLSA